MNKKQATTTKKVKVVGTKQYVDSLTGEVETMQVISIEERDFNFHKIWLKSILSTFDLIGNKKVKLAMWIIDHLDSENKLIGTQRAIATQAGCSLSTVSETVKSLQEADFLQKINSGAYRINPDIIFKGSRTDRMNVLFEYRKEADKGAASINETSAINDSENVDTPPKNPIAINQNNTHTDKQSAQHGTAVPYPANH
jgi:DNA-binding transcriptional regulator YhcF (GntR family)